MAADINVAAIRDQIPVLAHTVYLNSGWSGPSPRPVVDKIVEWLRWESELGPTSPQVLTASHARLDEVRSAFASALGGSADEFAILENTTEGVNVVLNGIDWRPGDEVVTANFEHGSVLIPLYHLRDRRGIVVKIVTLDFTDSAEQIVEKLSAAFTDRTRLLAISHISYSAGARLPLEALVAAAHAHNIPVLVDAAQSAGHIALDLHGIGVDYYALTGHKWFLGPDGAGALYVRRDRIEDLEPAKIYARAASEWDLEGHWIPQRDVISKFELSTVSPALLSGLLEAITIYQHHGAAAIESRNRSLGLALRERLAAIPGVTVLSPSDPNLACGLVVFQVDGREPAEVTDWLWNERSIVCRSLRWPVAVRAACHYFNTEADLDALAAGITQLAR